MKKNHLLTLLALCTITLGLTACGQKKKSNRLSIGVLQQINQTALDDLRDGFKSELKADGYGSNKVTLHYLNANGDQSNLASMSQKLAGQHNDLNIAIATNAAQAMAKADPKTPLLFTGVADPVATGLIKNRQHPEANASGVSATIDEADQIKLLHHLFPKAKTVGMLYDASEPNSILHVKNAKQELRRLHLKVISKTVTSTNDVQAATEALVKQVDAFYLPADNVVAAAMPTVGKIIDQAHIPAIPGDATMVSLAGVATRGIDFKQVGKQTAKMAIKVLKGQKIKNTPVENAAKSELVTSKKRMKMYGLTSADLK